MKTCKECKIIKSLSDFYKHKGMSDGHLNTCKQCKIAYQKSLPKRDPKYMVDYFQKNKESWRKRWWDNREDNLQRSRAWKKANPEKIRANSRKRRAMKENLEENFTPNDEKLIKMLFSDLCFKCHSSENLTIDHHYPLSGGNKLELDNAVLLCQSCNSKKHTKLPEEFYSESELNKLDSIHKFLKG